MDKILPPFSFKRNKRSRHIRITVSAGGRVLVSAPFITSESAVLQFLRSKSEWLWNKVEYFKNFPAPEKFIEREKKLFVELKERALVLAKSKVAEWNSIYNFPYSKIVIRRSRSRWGSCSSKGTLCFSYKIVFLPTRLADYLIVHEVCHLREKNHGKDFWGLVSKTMPDYDIRRKELRRFRVSDFK